MLAVRGIFTRVRGFFNGSTAALKEAQELASLNKYSQLATSLSGSRFTSPFHLHEVANIIKTENFKNRVGHEKHKLTNVQNVLSTSVAKFIEQLENSKAPDDENLEVSIQQTKLRVSFLRNYITSLNNAVADMEINSAEIEQLDLARFLDIILLGNSSERIAEHIPLYGKNLTQLQLQSAFYSLYEPEVQAITDQYLSAPNLDKKQKKMFKKVTNTFLLDTVELNSKSRCVFSWSVPGYSGFKPLEEDTLQTSTELIKARRSFFPEGDTVAASLITEYISKRKSMYDEKKDRRRLFKNGVIFYIATFFLDVYVSQM